LVVVDLSIAQSIMERTEQPAIFLGSQTTFGKLENVVTFAAVGGLFAELVLALSVPDGNGSTGRSGKESLFDTNIDSVGRIKSGSLKVGAL
jgi:hypothetical protein